MDYTVLKTELNTDPQGLGYAALLPSATGRIAEILNEVSAVNTEVSTRMVTARAILAECASGATILDKLEAAGTVNSAVKWAVKFLGQDAGIDVGHSATRAMIDALVVATVLTESEANQLKNMAVVHTSRARALGLGRVDSTDIQRALEV